MRRRHPTAPVTATAALAVAMLVAACGSSPAEPPLRTGGPTIPGGAATSSPAPGASAETEATGDPGQTGPPAGTPVAVATDEPAATDMPAPSAQQPGASPGADPCTGSAENRDFFAAAAEAMSWDVYCPVLPDGWFVETGAYRLADGGRLDVTYRGPGGEHIEVRQGAWCVGDAAGCAPRDHEIARASFGDRPGTLVALGGSETDGFAVYVDPGLAPSWAITGRGLDEASFTAIAAELHRVTE